MEKKIKIIQIIWGLERGGAELLLLNLCKGLLKKKYNIELKVIVYKRALELAPDFEKAGIEVICLDVFGKRFYIKIQKTFRLLKKLRPDIIHTHFTAVDPWALTAGLFAGVKYRYTTVHNIGKADSLRNKISRSITSRLANTIVAASHNARHYYIRNRFYPAGKLKVVYNCPSFSVKRISPKICPDITQVDCIKVVNIDNLRAEKGHIYLIRAMHLLHKFSSKYRLEIYGKDYKNYKSTLTNEVQRLSLTNTFFKNKTNDVPNILNSCHLLISSSIKEAFHMVVVEAMSLGVPFVVSDIPIHKELLKGVDQSVFSEQNNSDSIAHAVNNIITNSALYNKISNQIIERSRFFSVSNTVENYYNLYRSKGFLS